jgi:hypothetical protein
LACGWPHGDFGSTSETSTEIRKYTRNLYSRLEAETGQTTGFALIVPITSEVGMKKFFCAPESFTPDLRPIVGEAPELRGYFVAAGLNSIGVLTGGGLGPVLAH